MKKNYKNSVLTPAAFIVLLVFLHYTKIISPVEGIFFRIISPIAKNIFMSGSRLKNTYFEQLDKRDLTKIVKDLEDKNQSLNAAIAKLENVEAENIKLREFLDFTKNNNLVSVMANVVSVNDLNNNVPEEKTVIIDKGSKNGFKNGLAILNSQGVVVGKILTTRDYESIACLTTDSRCKFAVRTDKSAKTSGIAQGESGLTIKMDLIPQTEIIKEGDMIVTSGLEADVPAGLVLGTVASVQKENNELWQIANVNPIDDFSELFQVMVLTQTKK